MNEVSVKEGQRQTVDSQPLQDGEKFLDGASPRRKQSNK
jgi:hypothetical protein